MGHVAYLRKALDVYFPTIPIKRGKPPANRELHVVAGVLPKSVFDLFGIVGKLALPSPARFYICGKPSQGWRDMVPQAEAAGVFLVRWRTFFRSRFRLDRGKSWRSESSTPCMDVSSFQCARACGSTCCESGRLCAQAWQRRGKSSGIFSTALFCRPVFVHVVDVAPDVGFQRS
uniref:Uncharacterized protein n=1 Tax=Fagus sylvatica TaxID=28930 RepID=A0A2N9FKV2_FAGSY